MAGPEKVKIRYICTEKEHKANKTEPNLEDYHLFLENNVLGK